MIINLSQLMLNLYVVSRAGSFLRHAVHMFSLCEYYDLYMYVYQVVAVVVAAAAAEVAIPAAVAAIRKRVKKATSTTAKASASSPPKATTVQELLEPGI